MTAAGLVLAAASSVLVNWAYARQHDSAMSLPALSFRRPLRSLRLLLRARRWLVGFLAEVGGSLVYVGALALAPLSLVQGVASGGVALLAWLQRRTSREPLSGRRRAGVASGVAGLALIAASLAGGSGAGTRGAPGEVGAWLGISAAVAALALLFARVAPPGVAHGAAGGILFAAGNVTIDSVLGGGRRLVLLPAALAAYATGAGLQQLGYQRGDTLATAGVASLVTDALPIVAGTTLLGESLPHGALGVARVAGFVLSLAAGVALARR